jgi:heterodisulfide reductase subunit A-like polyferredoxin
MPASDEEIEGAIKEGVEIQYLIAPVKIIGKSGKVVGLKCIKMKLGAPDESGRRRPLPIEGSEFEMEIDALVPAIGQRPNISFLQDESLKTTKWETFKADANTCQTDVPHIFTGGDAVTGPKTVVEAIAGGKKAAKAIDLFLRREDLGVLKSQEEPVVSEIDVSGIERKPRVITPELKVEERIYNFKEVAQGLTQEMALAEARRCLNCGTCSWCGECEKACEAKAIDHLQKEQIIDLNVGAIIIAIGLDTYDPTPITEYGYGKYSNVYTSMEYERLICASGPTGGHLECEPDKRHPKRMAFIPCVGSRDIRPEGCPYCCSVCCMLSTKDAMLAREHYDDIESFIFYSDLRTFGKGAHEYAERAGKDYGVTYIHGKPGEIRENSETGELNITYIDEQSGKIRDLKVDFVVLSTAIMPAEDTRKLAEVLGSEVGTDGFFKISNCQSNPVDTTRPGIFVAGYCESPKDITESVIQASGVAARAAETVSESGGEKK